jgi:GntR family transcriptional regulator
MSDYPPLEHVVKIARASATPLYHQLANALRHQIDSGRYKSGAALPPESELIRKFRVSRVTTRLAIDLLVSEGLVVRKQGKGTYVRPPKIQQDLSSLKGFAELMAERGSEQAMQVITFDMVPADESIAAALCIAPGEQVRRIKRRHHLKHSPIAFAVIYIPRSLGRQFTLQQVSTTPIYTLLTQDAHIEIKRATQVVRAIEADQEVAQSLQIPRGAPVLMIERVTYSRTEEPVEFILFFYRSDWFELTAELHRDPAKNFVHPIKALGRFAPDS